MDMLEERGFPKRLIKVVENMYKRVCGSDKWKECFPTLSSILFFFLYMSVIDEYMTGEQTGRVVVLAYVDNLSLLEKTEEDIRGMLV